ncbi:MAG TPA: Rieske 2Fe-2S domain-containing protein [Terriglobia bacterium]|nr:Rieske 2Fe-2S domain-containing protein [Terriglobia bacterium]
MSNPEDPNAPAPSKPADPAQGTGVAKPVEKSAAAPATPKPAVQAPATAKAVTPPAAKPAAAPAKEVKEPDPNQLRRRLTWTCIVAFLGANFLMFLRFFFPRALFEPSNICNLGYPSDYVLGVSDRFKQECRIYVVREPTQIFAIFAKCTHLGCTPDWKPAENKFKCPCHGSGYTPEGINFEGPAPRPMDRAHVELNAQGQIIADKSILFMWDRSKGGRDEFNDPGAFIPV